MGRQSKKEKAAIEKYGKTVNAKDILEKDSFRKHNMRLFRERIVGMSKKALSIAVGVSWQTIFDWENPEKPDCVPSPENLVKLCEVFGCEPVDLYSDFRAKYLGDMLDDMLELILADFNRNIRSRRITDRKLAMQQFDALSAARDYQDARNAKEGRSQESMDKQAEMHKRRYRDPDDEDSEIEDENEE